MTTELDEAGASFPDGNGVQKPNPFSKKVTFTIEDDFLVTMGWDTDAEELDFRVEMPTNAQLSLVFGANLEKPCDMISFNSALDNPKVVDCKYENEIISQDISQDWFFDVSDYGSRHYKLF